MTQASTFSPPQPLICSVVPMLVRLVRPLALALLALLCLAPAASAAKRVVPQGFFGAVYDGELRTAPPEVQEAQWDLMAEAGVESVRTMFSWDEAQPDPSKPPTFE